MTVTAQTTNTTVETTTKTARRLLQLDTQTYVVHDEVTSFFYDGRVNVRLRNGELLSVDLLAGAPGDDTNMRWSKHRAKLWEGFAEILGD